MDRRVLNAPWLALSLFACCLIGCTSDSTASGSSDDPAAPPTGDAPPATEPAFKPVTTHETRTADGPEVAAPGATFNLPAEWQQQTPSSSMRLAQASIPGPDGNGELTVFFFGVGGGGGLEANIERWIGQVEIESPPVRDAFTHGDYQVAWVEAHGTLKPSTMGTGPSEPQPGSMLLGAVVEGTGGPWYFKATGPASTLDSQRDAFMAMLRSVRSGS